MRKYRLEDEQAIRTERQVREWTRSGLIEKAQQELILPELKVGLRRTNFFLRAILFAFGLLIILAFVVLIGAMWGVRDEAPIAILCFFGAAASFGLAEFLITNARLYRFGIEEAALAASGGLLAFSAAMLVAASHMTRAGEDFILAGLVAGAFAALFVYLRYGYLYFAIIAMICMSAAPFATDLPEVGQRIASAGLLASAVVAAWPKRRESVIHAIAWLGIYLYLNLQLSSVLGVFRHSTIEGPFYWFTFAAIWIIPPAGLFLALRERDRAMLDVNIVLALVTLVSNKPYLMWTRHAWDPILLGVVLIGIVGATRRWLSKGDHNGLTAVRILQSDKRGVSMVATMSAALPAGPRVTSHETPPKDFDPGDGRSGGAGASGSF